MAIGIYAANWFAYVLCLCIPVVITRRLYIEILPWAIHVCSTEIQKNLWHYCGVYPQQVYINAALLFVQVCKDSIYMVPDSKVHGANMGSTWVLSASDGPHVGPWTLLSGVVCCRWTPRWWPLQHLSAAHDVLSYTETGPSLWILQHISMTSL